MIQSHSIRWSVFSLLLLFASCDDRSHQKEKTTVATLHAACDYLLNTQSEDGGWHSTTHGLLKSGQAWTPFILHTLTEIPDSIYQVPYDRIERGLEFLRSHINEDGVIGLSDTAIIEYPNYATSYALRLFLSHGKDHDSNLIRRMTEYLLRQQFIEDRGITPENLSYGGWGFGEIQMKAGEVGHIDLSHTRRVLQALKASPFPTHHHPCFAKSQLFLRLLQKRPSESRKQPTIQGTSDYARCTQYDGGFYASPVTLFTNKGGIDDSCALFQSYATATCDGLLALLAIGYTPNDLPVQDGLEWLLSHPSLEKPEGIPEDDPNQWDRVMFFYHLSVRSELYSQTGWPNGLRKTMFGLLNEHQREDGSFANPHGALNKEDDPLLATAFAVIALNGILQEHVEP